MKIYTDKTELMRLLASRTQSAGADITGKVADVITAVRERGDEALRQYSRLFDRVELQNLALSDEERQAALDTVDPALYETMVMAADNIRLYHEKQKSEGYRFENNGKTLGRLVRPLRRVGIYVPGGTAAYPSTVLMNAIPAAVAGVEEIVLVTPPKAEGINPAIVAAAHIAGVHRIFTVGGAQAVAALAYGTESIPRVDKIVGPGNRFVAEAKRQVFGTVDIDMIAGPSEVLVVADESARAEFVAADLLSQLEHDTMASAILVTDSRALADKVGAEVERQLALLPRREIAAQSLAEYSGIFLASDMDEAMEIANAVAPEHLELVCRDAMNLLDKVENAGSIFIGDYAPEPMGDYVAGTNHVLPTNGTARFSSPLSVDDFIKKMSYLSYTEDAFRREAEHVIRFATTEGLGAHAASVAIRLSKDGN